LPLFFTAREGVAHYHCEPELEVCGISVSLFEEFIQLITLQAIGIQRIVPIHMITCEPHPCLKSIL